MSASLIPYAHTSLLLAFNHYSSISFMLSFFNARKCINFIPSWTNYCKLFMENQIYNRWKSYGRNYFLPSISIFLLLKSLTFWFRQSNLLFLILCIVVLHNFCGEFNSYADFVRALIGYFSQWHLHWPPLHSKLLQLRFFDLFYWIIKFIPFRILSLLLASPAVCNGWNCSTKSNLVLS